MISINYWDVGAHVYTDAGNQHYIAAVYVYDDDGGVDEYEYRSSPVSRSIDLPKWVLSGH
jgi:hypothetical protein